MDAKRIERLKITRNSKPKRHGFTWSRSYDAGSNSITWRFNQTCGGRLATVGFQATLNHLRYGPIGAFVELLKAQRLSLERHVRESKLLRD